VAYTLAPSQVAGQAAGAATTYTYGYTSGAWTVTATTANSGGGSHFTTTTLDGLGRTAGVQSGAGSTVLSEVDTAYAPCACSPVGKMSQRSQPYAPPNAAPPGTRYTYDALGRTVRVLLGDGASQTTYTYQGNFTTVTDPAGKWKQYASDAFGNLVAVIEPDPQYNSPAPNPPPAYPVTSAPTGMLLTSYTYDQLNHLTQVAMPRSTANGMKTQTRSFVYDSTTQRLTSATNPENGAVSYTYNADGTLATKTDANGNAESYTYDTYGRLIAIPDRAQTFTYDTCPTTNATGCVSAAGQLVQATFGSNAGPEGLNFAYNYAYTPAGKVSGKTLAIQTTYSSGYICCWSPGPPVADSASLTANYNYDNQGALTSVGYPVSTYPNGAAVFTYTRDAMERPIGMTDNNTTPRTWTTGVTYNAANQMLFDGVQTWTYNSLLQLTRVTGSGMDMTYNYSSTQNNGQIASSYDGAISGGETITYQYDALKRLLSAAGKNWGESYVYDGYGNLTQMNPTGTAGAPSLNVSVALDANNVPTNRIQATGVSYDNNGNLAAGFGGVRLFYDAANRVSPVQINYQSYYYGYDTDNRRMYYRDPSGNETIYFYGVDGKKLATYTIGFTHVIQQGFDQGYTMQLNYESNNVYFAGRLISAEGNAVRTDRLGSVRAGGPGGLGYQAQFPYGTEYTTTANDREKYATYTRDSLTGLDYAMNRYYSSQWGRFLSPDPYSGSVDPGNPQSWNRYAYVGGDPANGSDPSGLYILPPEGPDGPGWPGGGGPGWGINPGVGGWGFGFGGGYGCIDPSLLGNWYDAGAGLPLWTFGLMQPWCGPGYLPWGGGFGGGGGGSPDQLALSTAKKDLKSDLAKPDCAKDFTNASKDISKLAGIGFKNYGTVTEATGANGKLQVTSGGLGYYNWFTGSVNLNSAINWSNPNSTAAIVNGQSGIYQALAAEAAYINVPTLTAGQFIDLIILHELSHYNGAIGNPDKGATVEQQLYKDCIK
jgi:RHS repeat-associated protein